MESALTTASKFKRLTKEERAIYREHIIQCENSGITQSKYCEQHQLNFNTFAYQRHQFIKSKRSKKENKFVPVKPKFSQETQTEKTPQKITFRLTNGCTLELPFETPMEKINDLLVRVKQFT